MPKKTTVGKPQTVQQKESTDTPHSVLTHEDVLKFIIGLRLLGEQKKERFLAYMLTLREQSDEHRKNPEKEAKNDI